MMAMLLGVLIRGLRGVQDWVAPETAAVVMSIRNASFAGMIANSVSGGSADPGVLFFIAIAVVSATRVNALRTAAVFERHRRYRAVQSAPAYP